MLSAAAVVLVPVLLVPVIPSLAQADPTPSIQEVEARVEQLGREAEQAAEAFNAATIAQDDSRRKLEQLTAAVAGQETKVKALQTSMAGFAAAAYKSGGIDSSVAIFLAEDAGDFISQAASLDGVSRRQGEAFRQISVARQRLEQDKAVAAQQQQRYDAARQELAAQRTAVESKLAEQRSVLDGLKASQRAELERRAQAEAALSADRAERYQAASRDGRADEAADAAEESAEEAPEESGGESFGTAAPSSDRAAGALAFALAQVGKPYRYGASGPNAYDCSGLTQAAYASVGVSLPHNSAAQYGATSKISRDELQPGDLIFSYRPISHVSMYIGDGMIVHASTSGKPVKIAPVDWGDFAGASRP